MLGPAVLLAVALLATIVGMAFGGGAEPPQILDPGPVVRWGLPVVKLLLNLGISLTLGAGLLAVLVLDPDEPEFSRALDVAAAGAAVWAVSAAAHGFLVFTDASALTPSLEPEYGQILGTFFTGMEMGRNWLITALAGAVIAVLCFAVRNRIALGLIGLAAIVALLPMAELGHAGGAADHDIAVTALWLHLLFSGVWLGGLLTIVVIRPRITRERLAAILPRYSTIALVAFIVVAVSGYASAMLRIGTLPNLLTPYGILAVVKVLALLVLGLLGALQRTVIIRRMVAPDPVLMGAAAGRGSGGRSSSGSGNGSRKGLFALLVLLEMAFMGIASGAAAALARTAPPIREVAGADLPDPTPAQFLTGSLLPPEISVDMVFTAWKIDLLWGLVAAFGIFFYLAGVWRLHRRGDSWPVHRTVFWVIGMLSLFWTTSGILAVYQRYLFSIHMLEHMLLAMVIPIFLVLSAPTTLAMRAIHKRADGSRGPREWILLLVHSRYAEILTNPIVAAFLFAGSLWFFYFTGIFRWAVTNHVGHIWMVLHFLLAGYLFAQVLIGVDPMGKRLAYPFRLVLLLATMGFHAFFGIAIMSLEGVLLADWFGSMGRDWGFDPLEDQRWGGGIAWTIGEIPTVALAVTVAILWGRSDDKLAKRLDRAAERDGEAELAAYNAALARQAERDLEQEHAPPGR